MDDRNPAGRHCIGVSAVLDQDFRRFQLPEEARQMQRRKAIGAARLDQFAIVRQQLLEPRDIT